MANDNGTASANNETVDNGKSFKTPRLVEFTSKKAWLILAIGLAVVGSMLPGLGKLEADFTYRAFFHDDDPLIVTFDAFERRFGNDDFVVVAVHSPDGIFDKDSVQLLHKLTEEMWLVPEIIRVDSLTNFNWVHSEEDDIMVDPLLADDEELTPEFLAQRKEIALNHDTLPDYMVSADATTAMIFAAVKPGLEVPPDYVTIVEHTRKMLEKYEGSGHDIYLSGAPPLNVAFKEAAEQDMGKLLPMVLLMTILLLAVLMRSFGGVMLPILVVIPMSIMASLGFSGYLGIKMTNITTNLPQILIAIGVADSVHVLVTFYNAMRDGKSRHDAATYALAKNFLPTVLTSISTSIGFLSFLSADLVPIANLGLIAGFGTLVAWVVTYFVMGPLLYILPLRAKVRTAAVQANRSDRIARFTDFLLAKRTPVMALYGVLIVAAVAISTQNTVDSDAYKYFAEDFPARQANDFIESKVGGARGVEIVIDTGAEEGIKDPALLAKVEQLQDFAETIPGVTRTVSVVDILKQTNRSLHGDNPEYFKLPTDKEMVGQELFLYTMSLPQGMDLNDRMTLKNDALRVTVLWTIGSSTKAVATQELLLEKADELGLQASATGKNMLWQLMNGYVVDAFLTSLSIALVLISLLLIFFFRSAALGMLAMLPNVIPLIFGGAILFFLGQSLDIGTVFVISVCLGIAVDDTIHILTNYNRMRRAGVSPRDSMRDVLANTGAALVTTTTVLVISFGMFAGASFIPNLYFGVMTALILGTALITDLTFLPALLMGRQGGR